MYRFLRNIHLLLGLSCCVFLLMYGFSAFQMAHGRFFNLRPVTTASTHEIDPSSAASARAVALELMSRYGMRGELAQVREQPNGWQFRIVWPGTVYEVAFDRETRKADVKTNVANVLGMLNRIHHLRGIDHEFPVLNMWGVAVLVVSLMLMALGITGIYLWFQLHSERITGAVLLALSLSYSLTLIILIRNA
jgi:hypothetical protein